MSFLDNVKKSLRNKPMVEFPQKAIFPPEDVWAPAKPTFDPLALVANSLNSLGTDPVANIKSLVAVFGELLSACSAFYVFLDGDLLITSASWQAPDGYRKVEMAQGHISGDVILIFEARNKENGPAKHLAPITYNDLSNSPYQYSDSNLQQYQFKSYLGQPVRINGRVSGVLCAWFGADVRLEDQHVYLLSILAGAISLEEQRRLNLPPVEFPHNGNEEEFQLEGCENEGESEEELRATRDQLGETSEKLGRLVRQQSEIFETARFLAESLDTHEVLSRIGEGARVILEGDACGIYLLESDGSTLTPVLTLDEPYADEVMSTPLSVENSFSGKSVIARQAMVFNQLNLEHGGVLIPGTPDEQDERMIAAPFVVGDQVLGVMTHNRVGAPFTDEDLRLAQIFADFAAVVLNNARMYNRLQQVAEERRLVVDALQVSEERYRDLFENAADPILVTDENLIIQDVSELACDRMGYNRSELIGKTFADIEPPEFAEKLTTRLIHLKENGQTIYESSHLRKDGSQTPVEINARLVEFAGRTQIMAIARDIQERKERQREQEAIVNISTSLRTAENTEEMFAIISKQLAQMYALSCFRVFMYVDEINIRQVYQTKNGYCPWEDESDSLITIVKEAITSQTPRERSLTGMDGLSTSHIYILPLVARQQAVGAIALGSPAPFSTTDRRILAAVTEISANALHRNSLHESTKRQVRRLESLHTIDRAITSILNLETNLKIVIQQVVEQLEVDAADVLTYEAPSLALMYAAGQGFRSRSARPEALREATGLSKQAALEQRVIYIPDLHRYESYNPSAMDWIIEESFVSYLGVPLLARGQLMGVLELYSRRRLEPDHDWLNFMDTLARQTAIAIDNARLINDLQHSNLELRLAIDSTIEGWARALELRDKETEGHSQRVPELTVRLARSMGYAGEQLTHIRRGALLHDIGKMGIHDSILGKTGPLTPDEWDVMKKHVAYGYQLLEHISFLRPALDIPYGHHERWDGSGYPRGLRGEQIPHVARIFAVVDVWDALRHIRKYRPAWPEDQVRSYLIENSGVLFDPDVVQQFIKLLDEIGDELEAMGD